MAEKKKPGRKSKPSPKASGGRPKAAGNPTPRQIPGRRPLAPPTSQHRKGRGPRGQGSLLTPDLRAVSYLLRGVAQTLLGAAEAIENATGTRRGRADHRRMMLQFLPSGGGRRGGLLRGTDSSSGPSSSGSRSSSTGSGSISSASSSGSGGSSTRSAVDDADVNHSFIASQEGGQQLSGYVPQAGMSGVTVATGVDLGQMTVAQLNGMNIPNELKQQLAPYVGLQRDEAQAYLNEHPLSINHADADALDGIVMDRTLATIIPAYDRTAGSNGAFNALPSEAQTVITDLAYQYGPNLAGRTPNFWAQVTQGRWRDALANLKNFGDAYPNRRHAEAALIQQAINRGAL